MYSNEIPASRVLINLESHAHIIYVDSIQYGVQT